MHFESYAFSDMGYRSNNEDAWLSMKNFFAVADGMGGHQAGEVASRETVNELFRFVSEQLTPCQEILSHEQLVLYLKSAIESANKRVFHLGKQNQHFRGMGTTLCCLYGLDSEIVYAHVGDSRLYHYRNRTLERLTEDHKTSLSSYKNVITKAIGTSVEISPTIGSTPFYPGDIFCLCTDGLTNFVSEEEIEQIIGSFPIKIAVSKLITKAKTQGSTDNITTLLIQAT